MACHTVMVCGGAGYIGSHVVQQILDDTDFSVVILDNLSTSFEVPDSLKASSRVAIEIGDVRDTEFLDGAFCRHKPRAVVHMCASLIVPESVADPLLYYDNNVCGALRIAQAMRKHGCDQMLFSSTAALFGTPKTAEGCIVNEGAPVMPESPYGDTKHFTEVMMRSCEKAYGMRTVCLRYFNACGSHPKVLDLGPRGMLKGTATHLIGVALSVAADRRPELSIFGTDYFETPLTKDGTGVRDFIHVCDLATAHVKALQYLKAGGKTDEFNLGNGRGYSVREVVDSCRRVTGHAIPTKDCPRRPGDPPALIAEATKAREVLKWIPAITDLDQMVRTGWEFMQRHN